MRFPDRIIDDIAEAAKKARRRLRRTIQMAPRGAQATPDIQAAAKNYDRAVEKGKLLAGLTRQARGSLESERLCKAYTAGDPPMEADSRGHVSLNPQVAVKTATKVG